MKTDSVTLVLSVALVISLVGWASSAIPNIILTGSATSLTPTSTATIQKYFSINASANLSTGIDFGTIETLPATSVNASLNYNDTNYPTENDGNETLYFITVETDSNTAVDLCISADAFNTSGGEEIELGNYTYANNHTANNATIPGPVDQYTMSTSYAKRDTNVSIGSSSYFRFWLDVDAAQPTGTYNNTVTILGVSTQVVCP